MNYPAVFIFFIIIEAVIANVPQIEKMALISNEPVDRFEKYDYTDPFDKTYYDSALDYDSKINKDLIALNEKNCQVVNEPFKFINSRHSSGLKIICYEIPETCDQQCSEINEFDFHVRVLKKMTFVNYSIKKTSVKFNFESLEKVESDAFSGLVVPENTKVEINMKGIYYLNKLPNANLTLFFHFFYF